MLLITLAWASGGLMPLGYLLYITQSLKHEIEPNPTTWLMFSYGTGLLTALEIDRGASWEISVVPITCSVLGIVVAIICARRGNMRIPRDWEDITSFFIDFLLTVGYVTAWYLLISGQIVSEQREITSLWFLVLSNISTIPAFVPILRSTHSDPHAERALPWLVWSLSYAMLAVLTYLKGGFGLELMIYPVLNAALHGTVGLLALPHRRKRKLWEHAAF